MINGRVRMGNEQPLKNHSPRPRRVRSVSMRDRAVDRFNLSAWNETVRNPARSDSGILDSQESVV